ncbi:MAG: GGDEF domain-containing protein, partial [Gammaproteobacteria bacterium]
FMDIDHFKKINDQHGHQTGDAVLNKFSDIIKETKRASDIFSRYGGEEFVMLAHIIDMEDARSCAERLRQRIEQHHFDKVEKLTCSFGITEYRKDDNSHAILKRADEALYKAKEAGRNCVIQA